MEKAIIFDFDGTLIDTNELIFRAFDYVAKKSGSSEFTWEDHSRILGKPLGTQLDIVCNDSSYEMLQDFRKWYAENHDLYAKPVKNVEFILSELRSEGYKIGLVTNNSREGLGLGLNLLKIEDMFDVIVTKDEVVTSKPSPEGIFKAMKHLNVEPHQCAYIGDSTGDILAARAAGIGNALVSWTTLTDEQIESLGSVSIIESPHQFRNVQIGHERSNLPLFEEIRFFRELIA